MPRNKISSLGSRKNVKTCTSNKYMNSNSVVLGCITFIIALFSLNKTRRCRILSVCRQEKSRICLRVCEWQKAFLDHSNRRTSFNAMCTFQRTLKHFGIPFILQSESRLYFIKLHSRHISLQKKTEISIIISSIPYPLLNIPINQSYMHLPTHSSSRVKSYR